MEGSWEAWEEARTHRINVWWDHRTRDTSSWVRTHGLGEGRHEWGQNSDKGEKMGDECGRTGNKGGRHGVL